MAIAKLTEDSLAPEDNREGAQLSKLNELVDVANGAGVPAPGAFTTLTATGNVAICDGASDLLSFHGATPIAKQTGVVVSAAGIHAALVALGLIGA